VGWLSGWQYRKSHVINPAAGAGAGYQKRITVYYGSGSDSGENVYLSGKCRLDFGDIRFTKSDGETQLAYWMESKVDGDYARFWVKIEDDLSSDPTTIYIYYGNPSATTTSDGAATFLFFDHFDTLNLDVWERTNTGGSSSVADSILTVLGGTGISKENLASKDPYSFQTNTALRGLFWFDPVGAASGISSVGYNSNRTSQLLAKGNLFHVSGSTPTSTVAAGNESSSESASISYTLGSFRIFEIRRKGASTSFLEEDILLTTLNKDASVLRYILFEARDGRAVKADWILIRKYVDPEPSDGAWGSEESLAAYTTLNIVQDGLNISDESISVFTYPILGIDPNGLNIDDESISLAAYTTLNIVQDGLNIDDKSISLAAAYQPLNIDVFGLNYIDKTISIKPAVAAFDISWLILLLIVAALVSAVTIVAKKYKWLGNPFIGD